MGVGEKGRVQVRERGGTSGLNSRIVVGNQRGQALCHPSSRSASSAHTKNEKSEALCIVGQL